MNLNMVKYGDSFIFYIVTVIERAFKVDKSFNIQTQEMGNLQISLGANCNRTSPCFNRPKGVFVYAEDNIF